MKFNFTKKSLVLLLLLFSFLAGPAVYAREANEGPRGFDSPRNSQPDDSKDRNSRTFDDSRRNWHYSDDHSPKFSSDNARKRFFFRERTVERFNDGNKRGRIVHTTHFRKGPFQTVYRERLSKIFRNLDTGKRQVERSFQKFVWR